MHDTAEYTDEKEIVDQKAIELAEDFSYALPFPYIP